jgi:squalene cyclase
VAGRIPAVALLLAVLAAGVVGAEGGAGPSAERDLPPEAERAIRAGVGFLIDTQAADGSWLSDGTTGRFPVAITALAGLALLANGNTCTSGPHATAVRAAVEYVLKSADPDTGLIGEQDSGRPMFGHGFAMLLLAEVYGSSGQGALDRRIHDTLARAVSLTARSQSAAGGWYYTPDSTLDEGAVTVTQMQGMRACANAGIAVPPETVARALGYIRRSARPDGGIAYRAEESEDSRPGITCAGLAYARQNVPMAGRTSAGGTHFFYSHMYLSQVMYFRGGQDWRDYFDSIRAWLTNAQSADGSWQGDFIGRAYGTAIALLILQLPYNNLPVLQR